MKDKIKTNSAAECLLGLEQLNLASKQECEFANSLVEYKKINVLHRFTVWEEVRNSYADNQCKQLQKAADEAFKQCVKKSP